MKNMAKLDDLFDKASDRDTRVISVRGARMSPRAIELDISTLAKGAYIVQLEVTVAGQPPLRSEHRIEVTEGK